MRGAVLYGDLRSGGMFTVRVGPYRDRADADLVAARLEADQFKTFITKQ